MFTQQKFLQIIYNAIGQIIGPLESHIKNQNNIFQQLVKSLDNVNHNLVDIKVLQQKIAYKFCSQNHKTTLHNIIVDESKQQINQIHNNNDVNQDLLRSNFLTKNSQDQRDKSKNIIHIGSSQVKKQFGQKIIVENKQTNKKQKFRQWKQFNMGQFQKKQSKQSIGFVINESPPQRRRKYSKEGLQINDLQNLIKKNDQKKIIVQQKYKNKNIKDQFILIPLQLIKKQQTGMNSFKYEQNQWVSELYQRLSQKAFYGYYKKQLSQQQMKVFFSQNLILNTIKLISHIKKIDQSYPITKILQQFGTLSKFALDYQQKKYPGKKKIFIKPQIQNLVQKCWAAEDPQYDLLKNLNIKYEFKESGIYSREIKLMINKVINESSLHFQDYKQDMKKIFCLNNVERTQNKMKNIIITQNQGITFEYIEHKIGRKINENTPCFEQSELNSNNIDIKSPQILRILMKWIQQLQDKLNKPQIHIQNRYFPFVSNIEKSQQLKFSKQSRKAICQHFKKYLSKHQEHQFSQNLIILNNIYLQVLNYIKYNKQKFVTHISENNTQVGLTTYLLSQTISQIAAKYLNSMIHTILNYQRDLKDFRQQTNKYDQLQFRRFCQVNYITFNIYDLLRAKCSGTFQKIKIVYNNLKEHPNFKIIRVKNRLQSGNRDFLINMKYKNTSIICELQLGLVMEKNSTTQKQDFLDHFYHFLYQLKRSKYDPLTEAVILNDHYSETISYFEDKFKQIKRDKQRNAKLGENIFVRLQDNQVKIQGYSIQIGQIIYVCHNCLQLKSSKNTFLNPFKKLDSLQNYYVCGDCILNSLNMNERAIYLIGHKLYQIFEETNLNYQDTQGSLNYYLIISKNFKQKLIFYKIQKYYIQCFSVIKSKKYKFLTVQQLNIRYIFRVKHTIDKSKLYGLKIMEQLKNFKFINEDRKNQIIHGKYIWKQLICLALQNRYFILDACQYQKGYNIQLNKHKKSQQIQQLIESKVELMDLQFWNLGQEFFVEKFQKIIEIKKLNLSQNNLKHVDNFLKDKKIQLLKLNKNNLTQLQLNISNLQHLQITQNQLTNIKLMKLNHLKFLDLCGNELQHIQTSELPNLKELNLSGNRFKEITLTNNGLQRLNLQNNLIQKTNLSKLKSLKFLNLSKNQLKEITLDNQQLKILKLQAYNSLKKKVDLKKLIKLEQLELYKGNQFQQLRLFNAQLLKFTFVGNQKIKKLDLTQLISLKQIDIFENIIPIFSLENQYLQKVNAFNNTIETIDIQKLINLKNLNLSQNKLKEIELDNSNMQKLQIANNQLIKIKINKLYNLQYLDLTRNKFQELQLNNQKLQILYLRSNDRLKIIKIDNLIGLKILSITATLIQQISLNNENLETLILSNNKNLKLINLCKLSSLKSVTISNNNKLKEVFFDNQFLYKVQMTKNKQLNKLNLQKIWNIKQLNLSYNIIQQLCLEHYDSLEKIQADNNKLKNVILKNLPNIKYLKLSNNNLKSISLQLKSLQYLNLSKNNLQQILLQGLINLAQLDISDNCFTSISLYNNPKISKITLGCTKIYTQNLQNEISEQHMFIHQQSKQQFKLKNHNIRIKDISQ